ncbi:MAG: hypothetical protein F2774_08195 [Actinobacteria bacterium]|nr:hypothetical protein [Actinomycetota bacterium]
MASVIVAGDVSGTCTLQAPSAAGSTVLTLPVIATDTLAGIAATQTLTNKTLGAGTVFPAGAVLQVVNATYATLASTTSSTYSDTGLTATITPTRNTSKILVFVSANGLGRATLNSTVKLQLVRNATSILAFENGASFTGTTTLNVVASSTNYLDSPATTSATTYKLQFAVDIAAAATVYLNYNLNATTTSTITLMEIAG